MKKGLIFGIGALMGAASGGAATFLFLKQKFEQMANEEIANVRESFRKETEKRKEEAEKAAKMQEMKEEAAKAVKTYAPDPQKGEEASKIVRENRKAEKAPYVITPMQFAEPNKKYKDSTLKYYADGAIVDDSEKPLTMEEIDERIGRESLTHFGEYEDDSVCVRNERMATDFQILMMAGNYSEVLRKGSRQAG